MGWRASSCNFNEDSYSGRSLNGLIGPILSWFQSAQRSPTELRLRSSAVLCVLTTSSGAG